MYPNSTLASLYCPTEFCGRPTTPSKHRPPVSGSLVGSWDAFAFAAQVPLLLIPRQKEECQQRKRAWSRRYAYAAFSVGLVGLALVYSLTVNFLSIFEGTACLKIAGGHGCGGTR